MQHRKLDCNIKKHSTVTYQRNALIQLLFWRVVCYIKNVAAEEQMLHL